jgi:uncharacterized membrane protein
MSLEPWIHLLHVLSAMVWLGGGFLLSVVGSRARSSGNPSAISDFAQSLTYIGTRVLLPATAGTLVFGVWMVLIDSQWNFGQFWVLLAIGLFVLAFLIGAVFMGRVGMQLQRAGAENAEQAKALLGRWLVGYRVILLVLLIVVWDMIFKPGLGGG